MNLPAKVLGRMAAASGRRRIPWWQLSLRTLFVLTACCAVAAWFWQPLADLAQGVWEIWFPPTPPPFNCGPCGMG